MPRIAKWSEKSKCVNYHLERKPVKIYIDTPTGNGKIYTIEHDAAKYSATLFQSFEDYINKTIEQALKSSSPFEQFVDVKEVPYGRYNSDTDYR